MAWVDDRIWAHPKVIGLSPGAFRSYVYGLCYAGWAGTSGRLPVAALRLLGVSGRWRAELVAAGLWETDEDGVRVHDWDEHNGARDARRLRERERKRAARAQGRWREADRSGPLADEVAAIRTRLGRGLGRAPDSGRGADGAQMGRT